MHKLTAVLAYFATDMLLFATKTRSDYLGEDTCDGHSKFIAVHKRDLDTPCNKRCPGNSLLGFYSDRKTILVNGIQNQTSHATSNAVVIA